MNRENPAKGEGAQVAPHDERRRTQRVRLRVAVKLHVSIPGKPETIEAHTADVNDNGALLTCPENFAANARFFLEHNGSRQRIGCRVTRRPNATPGGFLVPVEFDAAVPGFWHIAFPPTDWTASE
ncbi:MAG TPA: PilZ domain-containing protein [Candidatus Acidoferrales bacterium]|nr:PilZ domain-containing protein [Candidatus Acidoferrales bacterium]